MTHERPDVSPEELLDLWLAASLKLEQAIGYLIQIVKDQDFFIVKQGGMLIKLFREDASLDQKIDRLEKEVIQLRRDVDELRKLLRGN